MLYGRDFEDESVEILKIGDEIGDVVIRGRVQSVDMREIRNERTIFMFTITDFTDTIGVKIFVQNAEVPELKDAIKKGAFIKVKGKTTVDAFDHDLTVMSVWGIKKITDFRTGRQDTSPVKRVELHCHTKMSDMDGVTDAARLVQRAYEWGHPAIAITDHGVVQSFPEANHAIEAIDGAYRKKYQAEHPDATKDELKKVSAPFKVIYGMEAYLVDDLKDIVVNSKGQDIHGSYVVFDIETTGFSPVVNKIIEIGAVRVENGAIVDKFSTFVNPKVPIPFRIENLTGINDNMVLDAPDIETVLPKFLEFSEGAVMVAHNASFDMSFIEHNCVLQGIEREFTTADTVAMARFLLPGLNRFKLDTVAKAVGVSLENHHRAVDDAGCTAEIFVKFVKMLEERNILTLDDLNAQGKVSEEAVRKLPSYHAIILAKNETGRVNLYRLVSESHLKYYNRRPKLPKSVYLKYQDGLMIGSACEAGELYRAVLENEPWEKIKEIASWYDYLEIQPVGNNAFLVREGRVADDEALRDINRKIVQLGDELGKPVVATGDVHFLDPHNAINRSIIQAGMGYDDADMQPPLYFKTTNEMLEEFSYLGAEKCHEVVIDNPRKIADQVDKLQLFPKHPKGEDTFQPFWEDAADNIQNMTWGTAKELYGDELPEIVVNRLNKELKSIIGYGFATLYNIAQRLVSKSNADGYLVGSRGSVGSSLVARMCGITEVNALPPHYRCTHCRKGFFDVDKSQYKVGVDLPDKDCPICGQKLVKDGFDIPFEVFLGFEGDKVPDIDLNFSGEYQNRAFHNVEELFGHDHVFRAGTITGLAEKTAYGYVSKYFEERGLQVGNTEKERLAAGCEGVKKTTGQHPGGMVVVPKEYEIYQFTAVQHPADDLNSDFTTTHFDFNSMHDILVKLDCLGHDDPTVLHMLEELTGIGYKDVPLDDPDVRSLFSSPKALGVTPEDIGCLTGTFGVPEFGTSFVRGMLDETKPTTMEELLRISGLSHGTDVWLGNAQELIANGTAKLSECVCCRDDIMNYLIDKGVAPKMAFTTMESVRKGRGLKPEMEQAMIEQHVPQWFMDSCKKIKYMFPKGHAVAYVTMALRVAWYKVHRPLAYYCAYFTVRGDGFDAMTMLIDPATIREKIKQIKADPKASAKDKEAVTSLELVLEMNMRGFKFLPCDLYKSDLKKFKMEGETGLRCPFTSLGGLGESAAINIVRERERGPFMSVEDLKERTRISSAVIELLRTHGSLEGLSETSQVCMF